MMRQGEVFYVRFIAGNFAAVFRQVQAMPAALFDKLKFIIM